MKDLLKNLVLNLWTNHRKKLIAFVLGLLFATLASISGIPLSEIQDAAKDAATKSPATIEATPAIQLPETESKK